MKSPSEHLAYSIGEFCDLHNVSRSKLYQLWNEKNGPRVMRIGTKILISAEAAADWRRARESAAAAG